MRPVTRTVILSIVLIATVLIGWERLRAHDLRRQTEELEALNSRMQATIAAKEDMIRRLGRTRRVAHVLVDDQEVAADGTVEETDFQLIELDDAGSELARQSFTVPGDVVFIDAQTVRFSPEQVAGGHPLAGRTLVLLRRVYSDLLAPVDGIAIDTPGAAPPGYAASDMGRFEQTLWSQFWEIARDAKLAQELGVRVAQGEAVYKRVRPGDRFELAVEAVGGVTLRPL